jgi:hypothetical protein
MSRHPTYRERVTSARIMGWAVLWRSENRLDGKVTRLMGSVRTKRPVEFDGYRTMVFRTRQEAREYISREYGDIRSRQDLQSEPHGWKMPVAVKVVVTVAVA